MTEGRPYDVVLVDWRMPAPDGLQTLDALRRLLGDGMPPAVLVTAFDDSTLRAQARAAGVPAVLPKPVTASTLQDTLTRLLRASGAPLALAPRSASDAEALLRQRHAGQRVLLAEDNVVNREVALDMLQPTGLVVDSADNGLKAVELVTTRRYDLVLMDVQMPLQDGLEATRRIRAQHGAALPIVAMTANAFGEDRQACLDAGMNDHLPKPVDADALFAMLLRWLPLPPAPPAPAVAAPPADADEAAARFATVPGMRVAVALQRCGGRPATLHRMLQRFAELYRGGLPLLRDGSPHGAADRAEAVHSLRGACATLGLDALADRLLALERALAGGASPDQLAAEASAIDDELRRVVAAVDAVA